MSEVSEALEALQRGERDLDDVETLFRTRQWPRRIAEQDTAGHPEGSFAEVADAYSSQVITLDQYIVLAEAASTAMEEQQRQSKKPTTEK